MGYVSRIPLVSVLGLQGDYSFLRRFSIRPFTFL